MTARFHFGTGMRGLLEWLRRSRWLALPLLIVAVLVPYHPLLTGQALPIPDDTFASDLADGEFPARVEAARLVMAGETSLWTSRIFTGYPLSIDPLSMALFAVLPPALALGWLIGFLLAMAAVGTFLLARQLGASRTGAFVAGFAFAWSGFFVCQLRHLGVVGTVAYFPLALFCLEMAATGGAADRPGARAAPVRRRLAWLAGFAALFGLQWLASFPQSAYISSLVYVALVVARALWLLAPDDRITPMSGRLAAPGVLAIGALGAATVGVLIGMSSLLPLRELGMLSDRRGGGTFEWATSPNYWPRNFLTFFNAYANGDISNLTYGGGSIFWEDYGYVGLTTIFLAIFVGVARIRRFAVAFWVLAAIVAYALVLGNQTPLFRLAFERVPGMDTFRFPTRFLFVVEFGLAILGGLGLTVLLEDVASRVTAPRWRHLPWLIGLLVASLTVVDLVHQNNRQNPFVDADTWLSPPPTAVIIQAGGDDGRVFAPGSLSLHRNAFYAAQGWAGDLQPYVEHRTFLQPNSNLLHGLATVDGYAGIAPRWTVDLMGDHNRPGILGQLYATPMGGFRPHPALFDWLEALSVRWVILPVPASSERLEHVASTPPAELYRLPGTLPRARIARRARAVSTLDEVQRLVMTGEVDLRREVLLFDESAVRFLAAMRDGDDDPPVIGDARIVVDRGTEVVVEATAPQGGLLLLADTFHPGWTAWLDGAPAEILRANVAHRAVLLGPGMHRVRFAFQSEGARVGLILTVVGLILLGVVAICTLRRL